MNTDFAQPGTVIAVYQDRLYGDATVTIRTVARRTANQIVLDNGDKYRVTDGLVVGDTAAGRQIRSYNDPTIVDARARQVAKAAVRALVEAAKPHPQKQPFDGMDLGQVRERLDQVAALVDQAVRDVGVIHSYFVTGTTPDPHTAKDED